MLVLMMAWHKTFYLKSDLLPLLKWITNKQLANSHKNIRKYTKGRFQRETKRNSVTLLLLVLGFIAVPSRRPELAGRFH